MDGRCICGTLSQSTGCRSYATTYHENGELVFATCEHGHAVVDKRGPLKGPVRFDECETPIYRISK